MVGNGNFAFTADITGLQTFPEQYSPLVPLMTQAQWAWHSFPNPRNFTLDSALVPIDVRGKKRNYPYFTDWDEAAKREDIQWLRLNPHRFSLGRVALNLRDKSGRQATFADIVSPKQTLDLWTGRLNSSFVFDGVPVQVETSVFPDRDILIVRLESDLLADGRLGVDLRFPGVSKKLNPDPADWEHPETHKTEMKARGPCCLALERQIDSTYYVVKVEADRDIAIETPVPHLVRLSAQKGRTLVLQVAFERQLMTDGYWDGEWTRQAVADWWKNYWSKGGVVDFTGSKHPKASELERRIVLSQYLTAVNSAGSLPPQEEGLFSNSWNGKFHLEMHPWHSAHFALWGRPQLLDRSMNWYLQTLEGARRRAKANGVKGAWWPKMVGPEGRESPSTVNPFIMWQQPHPIYLAEALWIGRGKDRYTLEHFQELVFETAEMLASWPFYDKKDKRYILGPPMIPAQENFPPLTTWNPTFELEYWRFGLATAQEWRVRLGMPKNKKWDDVLFRLSKLPEKDGLYLAAESQPDLWDRTRSPQCSKAATHDCPNRDHPSFVAALGLLPGWGADRETMRRTLKAVVNDWDLRQTWGWDWPMLAMTATRLDEPQMAVNFLLTDAKNFQFGTSGMTPRVHIVADTGHHAAGSQDEPGYRRAAETYFPSNGSLLLAVGLMVAGGQSVHELNPGFPPDGQWIVRSEGILPLP